MKVFIETTDTFGGEANYCWVDRSEIEMDDNASEMAIVRRCKKEQGITARHVKTSYGDMIQLDYVGNWRRTYITFEN